MVYFTEQEKQIIELLELGFNNRKIAETLAISVHTVKIHITNIYRKLEVNNRVSAVVKIYKLKQEGVEFEHDA